MNFKKIILSITLLLIANIANATFFIVDRFEDAPDNLTGDGQCKGVDMVGATCTLRAAIMEANVTPGPHTIAVPSGSDFVLTNIGEDEDGGVTGDLDISSDISIVNLLDGFVINGNGTDRIFNVLNGGKLTLFFGKLTNGVANTPNTFQGGAIKVEIGGVLLIDQLELVNNIANRGGAIFNDGDVAIENSNIHHNAITNENTPNNLSSEGNAILNRKTLLIGSSTLSHNGILLNNEQNISINPQEYAIHINPNGNNAPQPVTFLFNSTVADNKYAGIRADRGITTINQSTIANHSAQGIRFTRHSDHADELQLTIKASLFANNTFQDCNELWVIPESEVDIAGNFNASTDETCGFTGMDNLENIENPINGSLGDWGGQTQTLMINESSPTIDFVENNCSDLDQRGGERPLDGNDNGVFNCDVGAVEFDRTTDPIVSDVIFSNSFEALF